MIRIVLALVMTGRARPRGLRRDRRPPRRGSRNWSPSARRSCASAIWSRMPAPPPTSPVFRAPDLGQTGAVPVARIAEALRPYDVTGLDTGGLTEVVVTRLSRALTAKDITDRIARAFAGQYGFGDAQNLAVILDRDIRILHVEPTVHGRSRGRAHERRSAHRPLRHRLRTAGQHAVAARRRCASPAP